MPVWRIFYNPSALSADQRQSLAKDVTKLYTEPPLGLPAFYVNVLFIPLKENEFFIGGEPRSNFVRIVIEQIARTMLGPETEEGRQARSGWNDKIVEVGLSLRLFAIWLASGEKIELTDCVV
jgi:phenylpyruvate tautomerase PptA (4-oxalocrotonate tautomerase family)